MDEQNHPPEWDEFYRNIEVTRRRIRLSGIFVAISIACSTVTIVVKLWSHFH